MTAKEKAIELVDKMSHHLEEWGWQEIAKEQALICVDELIKEASGTRTTFRYKSCVLSDLDYWIDVKEEINKL